MMQHILSLSYGKDSLACLGAIEQLGWPLDRIIHAEVWATETIPADPPLMIEFKAKADEIIKKRWGIEVEHVCAMDGEKKRTYESMFYKLRKSGKSNGQIHGFPMQRGSWCNDRLKTRALDLIKRECISYIGIAADEPERYNRLTENQRSPLIEAGWTEKDCHQWCIENDLLSPVYNTATRSGCWFCHHQRVDQLRLLRKNYPEYWALMLKWDTDSPVTFTSNGRTLHDYDLRFELEDSGVVPIGKRFRWADVLCHKQTPGQVSIKEVLASDTAGVY